MRLNCSLLHDNVISKTICYSVSSYLDTSHDPLLCDVALLRFDEYVGKLVQDHVKWALVLQ